MPESPVPEHLRGAAYVNSIFKVFINNNRLLFITHENTNHLMIAMK